MSLLEAVRASIAKQQRGETLSELERVILHESVQADCEEVKRWKSAFREFEQLRADAKLPPIEPVRGGGMKCWHGADELVCTAMDEGGYGYFEHPNTGSTERLHTSEVTTRSPFGNFVRLRDVPVGGTFYWKDSTHWRPLVVTSFQEDNVCTLPMRGGNVFISNGFLGELVSYFPPEWCGQGWSLNPFTRELYIKIPAWTRAAASEHRTRNQKEIEGHANATSDIYPGLYYAFQFLKNHPDFVFRIPHFEYTVWTSVNSWAPSYCWTRAQEIPEGAVPACWKYGRCTALQLAAPEVNCGWYMTPDGVRFTGTNLKISYGSSVEHIVSLKQFRFGCTSVSFETDADLQVFADAYFANSKDYTGVVPAMRVQAVETSSSSTA
jgi:hypothetical protein